MLRAALALLFGLAAPAGAATLDAYGRLPGIDHVALSPDGQRYAAVVGDADVAQIQVRRLADGALVSVSPADKAKVRGLYWAGPDHLLAFVSTTQKPRFLTGERDEWYQVQDLDLVTRKSRRLLDGTPGTMNVVTGPPVPILVDGKPQAMLFGMPFVPLSSEIYVPISGIYRADLARGGATLAEAGAQGTRDWLVDGSGKAVAHALYDAEKSEWALRLRDGEKLVVAHKETAAIDLPALLAISADGKAALVRSHSSGREAIHAVDFATRALGPPIAGLAADEVILDPASQRLLATVTTDLDHSTTRFADPADQKIWDGVTKAFPGQAVFFSGWTADRQTVLVRVEGPGGDGYFVVDRAARQARPLGARYPSLTPTDIGQRRSLRYKAGDGFEVPAYLTLPPGITTPRGLPLIVLPHGGPEQRDDPGFDWWAAALASRGYAVLQPQFRGSGGFGEAHFIAGFGEWGRKMQTDLSDGVAHLAASGAIDPKRVCIVGASYGGYAALAGVTLQSGIYRCAASLAGVSDIRSHLGLKLTAEATKYSPVLRYLLRYYGVATPTDPALDRLSPAKLAARVTVPVQLIHGKDDTVVAFSQSEQMATALRNAGKPHEFVTLPAEDHWLSRGTTRVWMLNALVTFLEKHNPPHAALAPSPAGQ